MEKPDVIIIGAGVAGLFAARRLIDHGITDICIISKDIGGRVSTSEDDIVNYGAFFAFPMYKELMPYLRLTRRISKWRIGFVYRNTVLSLCSFRSLLLLPQLIRLLFACIKCNRKMGEYRKKCISQSQKQIIESDPYLLRLYRTKGSDFIRNMGIQDVADRFIDPTINVIGFDDYKKSNALDLLKWITAVYLHPMFEFRLNIDAILKGCASKIIIGEVTQVGISRDQTGYVVHTKTGEFYAENVIVATEPWTTRRLLSLPTIEPYYSTCHVRRVVGTPKGIAATKKRYLCFPSGHGILSMTALPDQSFLVYTKSKSDAIDEYFDSYKILYERTWHPSFTFCSYELLESRQAEGLFIAGDSNFTGIEDCALSGIYAAQKVVERVSYERSTGRKQ